MLIGEPLGDVMETQLSSPSQLLPVDVQRGGRRPGLTGTDLRPEAERQAHAALRAALRAEVLILAEPDAPHSVESLARAAGVSERSLCRGFQRLRGCGPMAAVRRVRLQLVHRDLLAAGPDGRVTDMAMRWGFYHLGRFSRLYAAQFGELPSATHRRSQARAARVPGKGGTQLVDSRAVAKGRLEKPVPDLSTADETNDVGMVVGTPVGAYRAPLKFSGTIKRTTLDTTPAAIRGEQG
jgi:AraC-like DNA-binding protein